MSGMSGLSRYASSWVDLEEIGGKETYFIPLWIAKVDSFTPRLFPTSGGVQISGSKNRGVCPCLTFIYIMYDMTANRDYGSDAFWGSGT